MGVQRKGQTPANAAEVEGAPPGDDVPPLDGLEQVVASVAARSLVTGEVAAALSASAAGAVPDEPPAALASLVTYTRAAASSFSDAEEALATGKFRFEPKEARELERLLRLGHQALSEAAQLLGSETERDHRTKILVVLGEDEPPVRSDPT
jgi:hypothetical protein